MKNQKKENLAAYYFHQGTSHRAYEYLGAHFENGEYVFRVWAPGADAVYLVGDFNGWDNSCPMEITDGVWEYNLASDKFGQYEKYKYKIVRGEKEVYKTDPYGFFTEVKPANASVYFDIGGFEWSDRAWMSHRKEWAKTYYEKPINIYEIHPGSWKRHEDGSQLSYRELADELAPYLKQMGYTHIELMPIAEHPFDGSWGYQICGYFAPTSRFGTPHDFMYFVNQLHKAGIGVILDWVPAHFPKDAHGLYEFDGAPLYEYQGADRMEHKSWGTRCFDVGRNEVESFLVSNAAYWANEYHIDGLRVDAVASMLYLDYDRKEGEWVPNIYGTNRSLEAIAFFKKLNSCMKTEHPDVLMIAEESTAWENVTNFYGDGLGFDLKWNMGWMNDTLFYGELDPYFRKYNHDKITFSMVYAFAEKYVLPISHDEVVHGKKSLLDKMPGEYNQKFAGERTLLSFMIAHPGKKLLFMGSEIGQFCEWNYEKQVEWFLLDYEMHRGMQTFVSDLNNFYLSNSELWEQDLSWAGFEWLEANNRDESILSFVRKNKSGGELVVIINFTPIMRKEHTLKVPSAGTYEEVFSSDSEKYCGSGYRNTPKKTLKNKDGVFTISLDVPPLSALILRKKSAVRKSQSAN